MCGWPLAAPLVSLLTFSAHFPLGSPSVAAGPGLLTVYKGSRNTSRSAVQVKMFILLPSGHCQLLYYIHTLGQLQADVASWILLSARVRLGYRLDRYWMLVSGQVRQGSTLYWMLASEQVDWRLAGGLCRGALGCPFV